MEIISIILQIIGGTVLLFIVFLTGIVFSFKSIQAYLKEEGYTLVTLGGEYKIFKNEELDVD